MLRRRFLQLPATAFAAALPIRADSSGALSWLDFIAQAESIGQARADTGDPHVDSYLHRIASIAVRLTEAPQTPLQPFDGLEPPARFGLSHRGGSFVIIQWQLDPGCILPAHNHPGFSVCTLCLEGEARLRNFEVEPGAPEFDSESAAPFLVRETHDERLSPGRVNLLAPARDNIHLFEAGAAGARGIDITTGHGGDGDFSYLRLDPTAPVDAARRLFEARWTGRKPQNALQQ